jgi:hypothetical protein
MIPARLQVGCGRIPAGGGMEKNSPRPRNGPAPPLSEFLKFLQRRRPDTAPNRESVDWYQPPRSKPGRHIDAALQFVQRGHCVGRHR